MNQLYQEAIKQLMVAKNEFASVEQTKMLIERTSVVVRNYGDERMTETFARLTKFKASTDIDTRCKKTIAAIDIMIKEFGIKSDKEQLVGNIAKSFPAPPIEKHSYKWIIKNAGVLLPLLGAMFYFGYYVGTVKYDKDKIALERVNDGLMDSIASSNVNYNKRLSDLKIEFENHRMEKDKENQNIWATYHKLLEENENLKRANATLRNGKMTPAN